MPNAFTKFAGSMYSSSVTTGDWEAFVAEDLVVRGRSLPQLRGFEAIAVDVGDRDFGIADTVRALDEILTRYGIDHTTEIYSGDHVSGVDRRLEANVLPFFSRYLAFE